MWYLILLVLVVALDQAVKALVQSHFALYQSVPVIEGIFHLTYIQNTGAAFSVLEGKQLFLILLTATVSAFLVFYIAKNRQSANRFLLLALSLIAAGGIGNLIDRIRFGYVVDFFDFSIVPFPVFNIADIAVTTGCGLLVIYMFVIEPKLNKKKS